MTAEQKNNTSVYLDHCRAEVWWYRKFGKYPDRITLSASGVRYVIGDWSWNRNNPDRGETIEQSLPKTS